MTTASDRKRFIQKVTAAKPSGGNARYTDGDYLLSLLAVSLVGSNLIVDVQVDESSDDPAASFWKGEKAEWQGVEGAVFRPAVPVGRGFGLLFDLSDKKDNPGPGNARAFFNELLDAHGSSDEEYGAALDALLDEGSGVTARGLRIRGRTYRKPIKKGERAGHPYVGMNWTHVNMSEEEIAANIARLDGKKTA